MVANTWVPMGSKNSRDVCVCVCVCVCARAHMRVSLSESKPGMGHLSGHKSQNLAKA